MRAKDLKSAGSEESIAKGHRRPQLRKIVTCCAGVAGLAVMLVALLVAYAFFVLAPIHESAGRFITEEVVPALKEMDKDRFRQLATPELTASETIDRLEGRLGKLESFDSIMAQTKVHSPFGDATYRYSILATFEQKSGRLTLLLRQENQLWKLDKISVTSNRVDLLN